MTKDMINNGVNSDDKSRIIQEYVPGKQITLAHMVTRPKASVYKKLGLPDDYHDAIGILTITPSEATIIAADIFPRPGEVARKCRKGNGCRRRRLRGFTTFCNKRY